MFRVGATLGFRLRLALCSRQNGINFSSSPLPTLGLVGPAARFLLLEYQIDPSKIQATGPRNALLKQDVLDYITTHGIKKGVMATTTGVEPPKTSVTGSKRRSRSFADVPLLSADLVSKTSIPHGYLSTHVDVTEIVNEMEKLLAEGTELCLTTIVIRACVLALKVVPELNAISDRSTTSSSPVVNVAMYVPSQGRNSVFGVLRGAEKMTMKEIEMNRQRIEKNVAAGTLSVEDAEGGTFSVCNLSDLNISDSAELVRPHQLATLTIGRLHHFLSDGQSSADRHVKKLRYQVVQLYKQLEAFSLYVARDYPLGEDYFKRKLRMAFRDKKGITDEKQICQALKHGNFVKKELETLYYVKKTVL